MVKNMKLKIISDGTTRGTKVIDEMGNMVEHVQAISWQIRVGELSLATIELIDIPIETAVNHSEKKKIRKRFIRCLGDNIGEETEELAKVEDVVKYVSTTIESALEEGQ